MTYTESAVDALIAQAQNLHAQMGDRKLFGDIWPNLPLVPLNPDNPTPNGGSKFSLNTGDTAWMLGSSAIVLFMTMPGLAIYYGGMVSSKNVLATVMQSFSICSMITVLWLVFGYSLAFAPSGFNPESEKRYYDTIIFGDASRFFLRGLSFTTAHSNAPTIPESVFCMFQVTFAIITAALICGSFADRMKYWSMMLFIGLWHLCAYCPIAHSMWHHNGLLFRLGVLDFAGGNVVHISSGTAGLVAALMLGNRKGWSPKDHNSHPPHNILLTFMGMSMLWVGWFGFNAGSATSANFGAGFAMLATQIATSMASISWMLTEVIMRADHKPSVLGMVNGAVAGLVAITPACGYVDMTGAFIIGVVAGPVCYFGARLKYYVFKIDDALDAFGIHAIGGITGGILTGFFATPHVTGPLGYATETIQPGGSFATVAVGVFYGNTWYGGHTLGVQCAAIAFALSWSAVVSFILLKGIDLTLGLRVSAEDEEAGLDSSLHGETVINSPIDGKAGSEHLHDQYPNA